MTLVKRVSVLSAGFVFLGVSAAADASICQGTSSNWTDVTYSCGAQSSQWWGTWFGPDRRFNVWCHAGGGNNAAAAVQLADAVRRFDHAQVGEGKDRWNIESVEVRNDRCARGDQRLRLGGIDGRAASRGPLLGRAPRLLRSLS